MITIKKMDIILILILGILFGFLYGEYKSCPNGKYNFDYGCEIN